MKRHVFLSLSAIALPAALGNLTAAVGEIVNRLVLGQVSSAALAASLPGSMLALVFTGVFVNTIGQTTALVARATGSGDFVQARRTFVQGLWLAGATVPAFLLALPIGRTILGAVGHAPDVLRNEQIYFSFSALYGLLSVFVTALGTWHAGCGKTGIPAAAAFAGCLTDMMATPALVLGLDLGMVGAGLARVAGLVVNVLVLLLALRRAFAREGAWLADRTPSRTIIRRILRQGLPVGLSSVVGSGTFTAFVLCLGACGAEALAVGNVCFALNNLYQTLQNGVSTAVTVFTGKCKGAAEAVRSRLGFRAGLCLSLLTLVVCYGPVLAFAGSIVPTFLGQEATDGALALARSFLVLLFVSGLFETVKHTSTGYLRGDGRTRPIFLTSLIVAGGVWMPAAFLITRLTHDANLLWPTIAMQTALQAILLLRRVAFE